MKTINRTLFVLALMLSATSATSQTATNSLRISTVSHMVGGGASQVLDTYLSAEHFSGPGVTYLCTVERQRPQRRWGTVMEHEVNFSSVSDRTDQRDELEGAYNFYWGRLRRWQLLDNRLTLQAGGMANAALGFIYNSSNSNNPAQARAHLNLMPTGVASYRFSVMRHPVVARYELALPLAGVMFSPNYGQTYYETFVRGDYDGNVRLTTFVSAPEFRQMLTLETPLSASIALRIGYLGNYQQFHVNHLKQHVYTHRFMVGITRRFSIISRRL